MLANDTSSVKLMQPMKAICIKYCKNTSKFNTKNLASQKNYSLWVPFIVILGSWDNCFVSYSCLPPRNLCVSYAWHWSTETLLSVVTTVSYSLERDTRGGAEGDYEIAYT